MARPLACVYPTLTRVDRPRADTIACIGFKKIHAGDVTAPDLLDANYIRRSDAEVKRLGEG